DLNGTAAGGCEAFSANLDAQSSATGTRVDPANCPLFCYRVTVSNLSSVTLTLTNFTDSTGLNVTSCSPTPLAPNGVYQCIISGIEHCSNIDNTVSVSGVSASGRTTGPVTDTA